MRAPFDLRTISSPYGWRRHPHTGRKSFHYGTDFGVPGGSRVRVIAAGKVIAKGFDQINGNTLAIEHDGLVVSKYFHLRDPSPVKKGGRVAEGQVVGVVGATGSSAHGDHLHLEVWADGKHVDPVTYLTSTNETEAQ